MFNAKIKATENITEYLTHLQDSIKKSKDEMVKESGLSLASMVYSSGHKDIVWNENIGQVETLYDGSGDAPDYTGALLSSGLMENQRVLTSQENKSVLEIFWTGMYADYSWWEFRKDSNTSKPPEVDYAVFQETGDTQGIPHSDSPSLIANHTGYFTKSVNDEGTERMVQSRIAEEYRKLLLK